MEDILKAAKEGDEKEVARLLDADPTLCKKKDDQGNRVLTVAAEYGHLGMVKLLLGKGARIDATGRRGRTALHRAAKEGYEEIVAWLLSEGAETQVVDEQESTPLILAASKGHLGVVQMLVEHMDPDGLDKKDEDGWTALHWAADGGYEEIVTLLLNKGADSGVFNMRAHSPIAHVAGNGDLEMLKLFIEHGRGDGLNEWDGPTSLHTAAEEGHEDVVAFLLDRLGGEELPYAMQGTPLTMACQHGHMGVVWLLLPHMKGGKVDWPDSDGMTALHYAAERDDEGMVGLLLEHGAQADVRDGEDRTPLMLACEMGTVRLLLQHVGPQGLKDRSKGGTTVLHHTARYGTEEVVAYLLSQGADATIKDKRGKTPLMCCGSGGVVKLILQHIGGQGLNDIDEEGRTALHYAALMNREAVTKYLLVAGADPTVRDNEGNTPRTIAERYWGFILDPCPRFVAIFDVWWPGELERRALLYRAMCLHKASAMQRDQPTSQVPSYLEARVAAGHAVPVVEVVSPQSQEQQQQAEEEGQAGALGKRKAAGEVSDEAQGAEEVEKHEVLKYVVEVMNEQLITELLEGFHGP